MRSGSTGSILEANQSRKKDSASTDNTKRMYVES